MEKLAHEWKNTPVEEPVSAGYGNLLLVLCLLAAVVGMAVLALGV